MLYVASDHGGFKLKERIVKFLQKELIDFEDLGVFRLVPEDDYTESTLKLVEKVCSNKENSGILLCRNGVGVSVLANKFNGIRAALSWKPEHAASSRNDDNSNVLALPADYLDERAALEIVSAWLVTPFSDEPRHVRRVSKVDEFGQK